MINHRRVVHRVLFCNPPWQTQDRLGVRAGSRWPFTVPRNGQRKPPYIPFPFFLAYAASRSKAEGNEVELIDAIAEGLLPQEFMARVKDFRPDITVIETSTPSIDFDLGWAGAIKTGTGSEIMLVGPHATIFASTLSRLPQVDRICCGEFDGFSCDGDSPYPLREKLPMYDYYDHASQLAPPILSVMASRGCPYDCNFCLWTQVIYNGKEKMRLRRVDDVITEIKTTLGLYPKFRGIFFEDDTWGINNNWCLEFAEKYKAEVSLPFCVLSRSDLFDYDLLLKLRVAGLRTFRFGVESSNQDMVNQMGKNLVLSTVKECIANCKQLGIKTEFSVCYGNIWESEDTLRATHQFILDVKPDIKVECIAMPYPGTRFYDEANSKGLIKSKDWAEYDSFTTAVQGTKYLTRERLQKLYDEVVLGKDG